MSAGAIAPNDEVRVNITEDAAARLSKELGTFSREIDGQFSPRGPDSVAVGIPIAREYRGVTIESTTQTLLLGRSEVIDVRKREFSRARTVLLSVGAVAGFGLLAVGVVQLVDPNGPSQDQTTPPPPPQRRPVQHHLIVRIPFP